MKILEEKVNDIPASEYHCGYQEYVLEIGRMDSHMFGDYVEFNPPLVIKGYKHDDTLFIDYDFGMRDTIEAAGRSAYFTENAPWTEKIKETVRFDLEHAFFHTSLDPNYTVIYYALLGCLCLRGRTTLHREGDEPRVLDFIP